MICAYEQVQVWLIELSKENSVPLSLDENGQCFLADKGAGTTTMLAAPKDSDHFVVSVDLMPIIEETKLQVFEKALTLNLYQQGTSGGALSYDPEGNMLVLSYLRCIEHTDFTAFKNILINSADNAKELKQQLFEGASFIAKFGKQSTIDPQFSNMLKI